MPAESARRKSTPKRKLNSNEESEKKEQLVKIAKKADDPTSIERNLKLQKTAKEDDFSKATYKKLIDDTFNSRRKFIERDAKSTKQIVGEYPFLTQPKHVSIKYIISSGR